MRGGWFGRVGSDPAMRLVALLLVFSLAFHLFVLAAGFHEVPEGAPDGYRPFYAMPNWYGYPAFFLLLSFALWLSWTPLLDAWRRLADTGVLQGAGDPDLVERVVAAIGDWRRVAWLAAGALTLAVNAVDIWPTALGYAGELEAQRAMAGTAPDAFARWLVPDGGSGRPAPAVQLAFAVGAYLQQIGIVLLACLAFFQVMLHTALFAWLERLAVAREHGLRLALDAESPLNEFGLEHWNHALNNFYWATTPALVGALVSRQVAAATGVMHPGQAMMNLLIPAAVLAPMIATVLARQMRLPEVWGRLQPKGPIDPARYLDQRLWPLDRNWTSKLGILLALAMAGLVIGLEIRGLAGI
jgi:hypothetical protein